MPCACIFPLKGYCSSLVLEFFFPRNIYYNKILKFNRETILDNILKGSENVSSAGLNNTEGLMAHGQCKFGVSYCVEIFDDHVYLFYALQI